MWIIWGPDEGAGQPESYALSIFLGNLKAEIGHYLDLFAPSTLLDAFQLARKIEVLISATGKGPPTLGVGSPRTVTSSSPTVRYSSPPMKFANSQSVTRGSTNNSGSKTISPALMAERKQKGLCFWGGAKYHAGHKCVKSQLYQFLLEPSAESEADEFQECSDNLEEMRNEDGGPKSPTISLHALTGLQGHNTMRVVAQVGSAQAIILVDSGSTHNFIDNKLVNRVSLSVVCHEQLKVSVANGSCLFTRGLCQGVKWEV